MKSNKNIKILWIIIFLQSLVFYAPIATIYREYRGIEIYNIFVIEAISSFLMILLEVPWGYIADKFGYKKVFIISQCILFISKIVFFNAYSFSEFLIERVLLSFGLTGLSGCDVSILYKSDKKENNSKNMSIYNGLANLGFLISAILSSLILNYSIDATARLTIIPYGIAFILSFFIDDVSFKKKNEVKIFKCIIEFIRNKKIMCLAISLGLIEVVVQSTTVFLDKIKYESIGISMNYFGIISIVVTVCTLIVFKTYRLTHKFEKETVVKWCICIISISCIVISFSQKYFIVILCIVLIKIAFEFIVTISYEFKNNTAEDYNRATIISIYSIIINIVYLIIYPIIGWAAKISLSYSFLFCGFIIVIAIAIFCKYNEI